MNVITWSLSIASITGAVLNARQRRAGFGIWIVANTGWIIAHLSRQLWAEAALFFVYLLIALYGFAYWRQPQPAIGKR